MVLFVLKIHSMAAREAKAVAVVPALNEAETIGEVVSILKQSPFLHQVIVVSDGSTDDTAMRARAAGADIVHEFPWRKGKGAALQQGIQLTDAPVVVFFDADLLGLTTEHVRLLVEPVFSGICDMNVGVRDRGRIGSWLARHLPLIGGERAIDRRIIEGVPSEYLRGWKIESALNYYCKINGFIRSTVFLQGLHIRRKISKFGFWIGLGEYLHMFWQIGKAMIEVRRAHSRFVKTSLTNHHGDAQSK